MAGMLMFVEVGLGVAVAYFAWLAIDGETTFAAYSTFFAACVWLVEWLRRSIQRNPSELNRTTSPTGKDSKASQSPDVVPPKWQGIIPPQSRYRFTSQPTISIPVRQSFSFEYGPYGHARALNLEGTTVRADIQFTCRLTNAHRAMFSADEFALNVLQPKFLSHARDILERCSLTRLRAGRQEVARDIVEQISPHFEELGYCLESVSIGALDKVKTSSQSSRSRTR